MADYSINAVTRRVVYTGSAGVGPYAFSFEVLSNTDVAVYKNVTLLTLTTDYTVTINSNGTGSVTLTSAATSTDNVVIIGKRAISRTTDFVTAGDLQASALNDQLDSQIIMLQQLAEENKRTIKAPQYDPASVDDGGTLNMVLPVAASRAGKVFAFDLNGNPTIGDDVGNWRGTWAAGQAYTVRDLVKDASNSNIYRCNTAHTSVGSSPISSNSDVAKWNLVIDVAAPAASAAAAAASATAAASSATSASSSASAASSSASSASTSATTATTQASSATSSASAASASASAASASQTAAANSATSASTSASLAAAAVAGGLYSSVFDKSTNYTVVAADAGDLIRVTTTSGAVTITLPQISTVTDGFKVAIVKWTADSNAVNVARSGSDTINGAASASIGSQYTQTTFVADFETNQWFAATSGLGSTNVAVDVFNGTGSQTAFTLSGDPGTKNNTYVYVSGVYQNKSTYSLSTTTLTFSTAPPSGTGNVEIVWTQPLPVGTPSDGTVTRAKLSVSGTPDGTKFLRDDMSWQQAGFAAGTQMLFVQTAAPTGWTKVTTYNDYALRVVNGTASVGGSVAFSTAFASQNVGATTLSTAQIPSHTHSYTAVSPGPAAGSKGSSGSAGTFASNTGAQGGGGSHTHTLNIAVNYVDVIIASKN